MAVLGDELDDRFRGLIRIAQLLECPWNRVVDDLQRSTSDKLLELDQREVRLDAGGVAIHHESDGVVADETRRDIRDVFRHREVERRLHSAVGVLGHWLEEVIQCAAEPVISGRFVNARAVAA